MAQIRPSQIRQNGASPGQVLVWNGTIWAATPAANIIGGSSSAPTFAALDKYRTD